MLMHTNENDLHGLRIILWDSSQLGCNLLCELTNEAAKIAKQMSTWFHVFGLML